MKGGGKWGGEREGSGVKGGGKWGLGTPSPPLLKRRLHRLAGVYSCQNATLLEISCRGSFLLTSQRPIIFFVS